MCDDDDEYDDYGGEKYSLKTKFRTGKHPQVYTWKLQPELHFHPHPLSYTHTHAHTHTRGESITLYSGSAQRSLESFRIWFCLFEVFFPGGGGVVCAFVWFLFFFQESEA